MTEIGIFIVFTFIWSAFGFIWFFMWSSTKDTVPDPDKLTWEYWWRIAIAGPFVWIFIGNWMN